VILEGDEELLSLSGYERLFSVVETGLLGEEVDILGWLPCGFSFGVTLGFSDWILLDCSEVVVSAGLRFMFFASDGIRLFRISWTDFSESGLSGFMFLPAMRLVDG